LTLNNVIYKLQAFAELHKQVKHFDTGDLVDILTNGDITYPACFLEQLNGSVSISSKVTDFSFRIWFCDLADTATESQRNEVEVKSDLTSICEDYAAMLNSEAKSNSDFILSNTDFQIEYFTEKFEDVVIAAAMNITIGTKYLANRCQVPAIGIPSATPTYSCIVLNNFIYKGLGTEGNTLTISDLMDKEILMIYKGDKLLVPSQSITSANDYTFNIGNGTLTFGNDIEFEQVIQILFKKMAAQTYLHTGTGLEGNSITVPSIANRKILMVFKGDKVMVPASSITSANDFVYTLNTGKFLFGNDIESEQIIQILWVNL